MILQHRFQARAEIATTGATKQLLIVILHSSQIGLTTTTVEYFHPGLLLNVWNLVPVVGGSKGNVVRENQAGDVIILLSVRLDVSVVTRFF